MALYRHHKFLVALVFGGGAWAALYLDLFKLDLPLPVHQVVEILPLYLLIVLGCYALASIGSSLFMFNNCPEATAEVQQDILDAKAFLKTKGVSVD